MADDGEEWKGEEEKPMGMSFLSSMWHVPTPEELAAAKVAEARRKAEAEMRSLLITPFKVAAKCAKCGHEAAKIRHCASTYSGGECFSQTAGKEHFHRTCKQCRYVWYEWPLDA